MTSAEQFFTYGVLKTRPDNDITDGLGLPDPTLLGALAVTWIILYFSLRGGVGGQGKVVLYNRQEIGKNVDTIGKTLRLMLTHPGCLLHCHLPLPGPTHPSRQGTNTPWL